MNKRRYIFIIGAVMVSALLTTFLIMNESAKPPLIKGLPSSSFEAVELELKRRLQEEYPAPLAETDLIEDLSFMGFVPVSIGTKNSYAVYHENAIICQNEWRIMWDTIEAKATNIRPMITSSCL